MKNEREVNDNNFEKEVVERSKEIPVVVDFWAPWCMPCRILSPSLEKLAKKYERKFILAKIDVNEYKEKARQYKIMSIPCVKMFKNGKVADEFIGFIPEDEVKEWLDKNL
ncbi:thioredoxin [Candidatus Woesearchaeota archaeon]|nr:thioredoxin [Candidatus Woesearchaeota archaeon]